MAKELWHDSISKHTEWAGDASTEGKAVAGDAIQRFIKDSFNSKIGYLYPYTTATSSKYWAFADKESCDLYLAYFENPTNEEFADYAAYKLGEWDAPAPYTASITLITDANKDSYHLANGTPTTLLSSQTNNYLYFAFEIKDNGGTPTNENVKAEITFTNNGATKSFSGTFSGGTIASVLLDDYLQTGNNVVNITITGNSSEASTKTSFTITSVQLNLSSNFEFYNALEENTENLIIPFTLIGAGTKFVEWYIDGELVDDGKDNPIAQTNYSSNKFINILDLEPGKHNVQFRSYVEINTIPFYGSSLYYDFFIKGTNEVAILLSGEVADGTIAQNPEDLTINFYQFEKSSVIISTYDYQGRNIDVNIYVNDSLYSTLRNNNGRTVRFDLTPDTYGIGTVDLRVSAKSNTGVTDYANASFKIDVEKSQLSISETKGGIKAKFSAKDRSNDDANKSVWQYRAADGSIFEATFNNVPFNKYCGWYDDALILSNGATVTFNFNPFSFMTSNGFTFEIEFETSDIKSDDVKIMKFGGSTYKSFIEILATSAQLNSDLNTNVKTNYRDGERMKLAFVINSRTSADAHNLMWIINNGILERCAAYQDNDSFQIDPNENTFTIGNPNGDVTVKIYSIRIYEAAVTTLQEFENYALDSGRIASLVSNNDVLEDGKTTVSLEKVKNKLPVMLFTGDMEKLRKFANKKSKVLFDVEYTNPTQPEYNFKIHNAYVTKQGTSSIKYPCPNIRLYIKKEDSITFQLTNLEDIVVGGKVVCNKNTIFEVDKMYYLDAQGNKRHPQTHQITKGKLSYAFKDGALPNQVWTLKADFAESSMTHNTGTARWWGSMLREVELTTKNAVTGSNKVCKTRSQMAVENANAEFPEGYYDAIIGRQMQVYPFDIHTAIDGFPMCIFARQAAQSENVEDTKIKFMGLFNFNIDKSSTDSFGFKKIEVYTPKAVNENGEAIELKKTKIWDTKKTFCWEGSANEEALGKYLNERTSAGCVDDNGNPSYDPLKVDDRAFYAAFETRYPDADGITLTDGTKIPADMFNNSTCFESLIRFVYFTKPAVDVRVFLQDGEHYEDGYTLKQFNEATNAQIVAFRDNQEGALYVKTSDDSLGVAATYESIGSTLEDFIKYADFKTITYSREDTDGVTHYYSDAEMTNEVPNIAEATFYVDNNGRKLSDQTDITLRVWQTQFYTKRTDIDYEHVERYTWKADDGAEHRFNDFIYIGWVKSWHMESMERYLQGREYVDEDGNVQIFDVTDFATYDNYDNGTIGDNNVEVYLTKVGEGRYTYVDDFGNVQNYNINPNAIAGQLGAIKQLDYRGRTYMDYFSEQLSNHYDIYKLASYFIYVRRFGAVDQMVKNVMITTEDRDHWYYIHYDNDTILGVRNDSIIKYNWDLNRNTYDASVNNYAYAGFQSVLWNNLECCKTFMDIVKQVDSALAKLPVKNGKVNALTYDGACYWYDTVQADAWPEKLYNASEDYKYVSPYIENTGNSPYLAFLQGNRKSHRHWWLRHRFDLIDAEWVSGEYADFYIGGYIPCDQGTPLYKIKSASDFYYGFMTNTDIRESGVYVKGGQEHTFYAPSKLNVGDPVKILGPYQIEELDFSVSNGSLGGNMVNLDGDGKAGIYIDTRGTKLKKLIIGHKVYQTHVAQVSSLTKVNQLQWLDISNCVALIQNPDITQLNNLHIFEAEGANITTFYPCEGTNLYRVVLPSFRYDGNTRIEGSPITNITLKDVTFDNNLNFDYKNDVQPGFIYEPNANLDTVDFENVKGIDTMEFVRKWYNAILESGRPFNLYNLTLIGINWTNAQPSFLLALKQAGFKTFTVKGNILFQRMSYNEYAEITKEENYGPNVFNTSGELVFDAPDAQYLFTDIAGQKETVYVKSGSSVKFSTVIFPLNEDNIVTYRLMDSSLIGDNYLHRGTDPNGLDDYYEYNNYKLYTKTGVLQIAETTSSTSIRVLIELNGTLSSKNITIYASGVTVPQVYELEELNGLSTNLTFETIASASYKVVLENNNFSLKETDALAEDIRYEIYTSDTLVNDDPNYVYGDITTQYIKCFTTSYDEFSKLLTKDLNVSDSRDYFVKKNEPYYIENEDGEQEIAPAYVLVRDKSQIDLTGETVYYVLKNGEYIKLETRELNPKDSYYYFTKSTTEAETEYYDLVTDKSRINLLGDVTYYKLNHVVIGNIERNDVPTENTQFKILLKPLYRTTIEANKMPNTKTVNINVISVIPSTYKFEIKPTLNPGFSFGICTEDSYAQKKTLSNISLNSGSDLISHQSSRSIDRFDALIIIDAQATKNIVGLKFRKTGRYYISIVGYTANNITSNVGIDEDIRLQWGGLDYEMEKYNDEENPTKGFYLVVNPHEDAETGKDTTNITQNDTYLTVKNKMNWEGLYCNLNQSNLVNTAANNSLKIGLYITYPTVLEISGDDIIGVSYETSKSVQHNYTVYTEVDRVKYTDITKVFTYKTRFVPNVEESNTDLLNNITFVTNADGYATTSFYKFNITGSSYVGTVKGKVITEIYLVDDNTVPYLVNERNLTFEFTYASATTAEELIEAYKVNYAISGSSRLYYLMDENRSFYLLTKENGEWKSGGWEQASETGLELMGIATVFGSYNNDTATNMYFPICFALRDMPTEGLDKIGLTEMIENIKYVKSDGSYEILSSSLSDYNAAQTYGWYGWEKKTLYRTNNLNTDSNGNLFNNVINLYKDYPNISGRTYVPDGAEMWNLINNMTDINEIITTFDDETGVIKSTLENTNNRYFTMFTKSRYYTFMAKYSTTPSEQLVMYSINNTQGYVRPFIRIAEI